MEIEVNYRGQRSLATLVKRLPCDDCVKGVFLFKGQQVELYLNANGDWADCREAKIP